MVLRLWGRDWLTAWNNPTEKAAQRKSRWLSVIGTDTYMESMTENNFLKSFQQKKITCSKLF